MGWWAWWGGWQPAGPASQPSEVTAHNAPAAPAERGKSASPTGPVHIAPAGPQAASMLTAARQLVRLRRAACRASKSVHHAPSSRTSWAREPARPRRARYANQSADNVPDRSASQPSAGWQLVRPSRACEPLLAERCSPASRAPEGS